MVRQRPSRPDRRMVHFFPAARFHSRARQAHGLEHVHRHAVAFCGALPASLHYRHGLRQADKVMATSMPGQDHAPQAAGRGRTGGQAGQCRAFSVDAARFHETGGRNRLLRRACLSSKPGTCQTAARSVADQRRLVPACAFPGGRLSGHGLAAAHEKGGRRDKPDPLRLHCQRHVRRPQNQKRQVGHLREVLAAQQRRATGKQPENRIEGQPVRTPAAYRQTAAQGHAPASEA